MTISDETVQPIDPVSALIAKQNDMFRQTWGAAFTIPGRIVTTAGVAALGWHFMPAIMVAVMKFDQFTDDNDPYGWHDFGIFSLIEAGETISFYWKIDLYDNDLRFGSEQPEDPTQTTRVLTIYLPSEH
jgi:hypothetical protein